MEIIQPGNDMAIKKSNGKKLLQAQMDPVEYQEFETMAKDLGLRLADYTRILVKRELKSKGVFNSMAAAQAGE